MQRPCEQCTRVKRQKGVHGKQRTRERAEGQREREVFTPQLDLFGAGQTINLS